MGIVVEATYENGVFRPLQRVHLPEHGRVRLVVEPESDDDWGPPGGRIVINPDLAHAIAEDPELARRR